MCASSSQESKEDASQINQSGWKRCLELEPVEPSTGRVAGNREVHDLDAIRRPDQASEPSLQEIRIDFIVANSVSHAIRRTEDEDAEGPRRLLGVDLRSAKAQAVGPEHRPFQRRSRLGFMFQRR